MPLIACISLALSITNLSHPAEADGLSGAVTSYYPIGFERFEIETESAVAGAIASLGNDVFFARPNGRIYLLDGATFSQTSVATPFEREAQLSKFDKRWQGSGLGVRDFFVESDDGTVRIVMSHTFVDETRSCLGLRISKIDLPSVGQLFDPAVQDISWQTVFSTPDCIGIGGELSTYSLSGAIIRDQNSDLILSVGDFGFEFGNTGGTLPAAQSPDGSLGKILRISEEFGTSEIVSSGHRNPGGLTVSKDGTIWAVEHGPRGGDELNRILPGQNYGWPLVTYGTDYGGFDRASDLSGEMKTVFTEPAFAWLSSIAPSSIATALGGAFAKWNGDLIVTSLRAKSIYRLHLAGQAVVSAEQIFVGERIRDLTIAENGELFLLLDTVPAILKLRNLLPDATRFSDPVNSQKLVFCSGCHQISDTDNRHVAGPSLVGLMGRPVALARHPDGQTIGPEASRLWSTDLLDEFLQDTQRFAPGTSMPEVPLSVTERSELISAIGNLK